MKTTTQSTNTRISKDGTRVVTTEYEVRLIDQNGDAFDVQHHDTKSEALTDAPKCVGQHGAVAVVVEKHVSKRPAHLYGDPDVYTILATFGDRAALEEGGWVS